MKTVLVVGGAGYIGAHTCKLLAAKGYRPVVFDNFSTGHRHFVQWGPCVEADILDFEAVADAIRTSEAEAVLHFAAFAAVGESVVDPEKYYLNNVAGSIALLRGMRLAGCQTLVFSSTCAVYGEPPSVPIAEDTLTNPVNPYGVSKLYVERMLEDYRSAYNLNYTSLRYFNACGGDEQATLGELRDPETHIIPRAMMAIQGYLHDFSIFGTDFDTPDGTAVRDYIHVTDLGLAHIAALDRLLNGDGGGIYNLGAGRGYSVKEVIDAIEVITGETVPRTIQSRRPGDPGILVADSRRASIELGFSPRHSSLANIVRTAWKWHQKAHPKLERISGSDRASNRYFEAAQSTTNQPAKEYAGPWGQAGS